MAKRAAAMAVASFLVLFGAQAIAAQPEVAEITEPAKGSGPLDPGDVHMVAAFADADEDEHLCSDWQIRPAGSAEPAWEAHCAEGGAKIHIHFGDGEFVNDYAGRDALDNDSAYELWVRFKDGGGDPEEEWSEWMVRPFTTREEGPEGSEAEAWTAREGFVVEKFAEGLRLPTNIAMVPEPGSRPGDPLMYVTELYGDVKVVTRDGTVRDYATDQLNFDPTGDFPGSGEMGLTGIVVEPATGDVFVTRVHRGEDGLHPQVVRLVSDDHGFVAIEEQVLPIPGLEEAPQEASHQISNLTISPEGNLFVHSGDAILHAGQAPDLDSYLGKILRMELDGSPVSGEDGDEPNPYYDATDGIDAEDYVYASGLRNPFGGAWRLSDGTHWEVENGPSIDRLAKVIGGEDYDWPGDQELRAHAAYNWEPSHAPVNIDFVEAEKYDNSGFPSSFSGHAFVTESGPTYRPGPLTNGKAVVEFELEEDGDRISGPDMLARYTGVGRATAVGLAAGPGGLYFTDLYKDTGASSPIDRGANVLRIRYCGTACPIDPPPPETTPPDPPPTIDRFRSVRKVFAVGLDARVRRFAVAASAAGRGTAFLYRLSEDARVWIGIRPLVRGWRLLGRDNCRLFSKRARRRLRERVGLRRCVLPEARGVRRGRSCRRGSWLGGRGLLRAARCVLRRPHGVIRASGRAGENTRLYAGRLDGRRLTPGRYLGIARARDQSGNPAKPRYTTFRVARAR
jgi:glucose/arabinose dehydrogenase